MASGGNEISSDEIPDFQCMSCDNRTVVKYCVDCQGYCCQSCVDIHSRLPITKGHTFLDKSNLQTSSSPGSKPSKLPLVPTERCDIHTIKILDMYCGDHDVVGCTTCMVLDHRSCNNVHSIPDDIDVLYNPSDINEVSEKLQKSKEILENIKKRKDELLEGLLASKEEADNKIENAKIKIIEAAKNMEKKSLEEVENMYQKKKSFIEIERNDAIDIAESIGNRVTASKGNKAQQFVSMKIGKKKIEHVKEVEFLLTKEIEAKINFTVDPNIQNCFGNMTTFGKTSIESSLKEKTDLYMVDKCVDMNVRLPEDTSSCNIFGSCLTEDGSLLITDHNNKKLKRANINTAAIDAFCKFDASPVSVCCTSRQEAVATFFINANYIQLFSLGNKLTPSRKVKISHDCLGISCKNNKLYITDNRTSVYIHDKNGNELQVISCDSSGNNMFTQTRNIAFSDTTDGIIVVNLRKGVIILDRVFQRVSAFSDNDLVSSNAVCTDQRGNIFVSGFSSSNVMQIGKDGNKRGVVVSKSDGLQKPYSVCFDSSQCKLIVTQQSDIVKIFALK